MHGHDVGSSEALHILKNLVGTAGNRVGIECKTEVVCPIQNIECMRLVKLALLFSNRSISVSSAPVVKRSSGTVPDLPGSPAVWTRLSGRGQTLN